MEEPIVLICSIFQFIFSVIIAYCAYIIYKNNKKIQDYLEDKINKEVERR